MDKKGNAESSGGVTGDGAQGSTVSRLELDMEAPAVPDINPLVMVVFREV